MRNDGSYYVIVKCQNCNYEDSISIKVGSPVKNQECPNCNLKELIASDKIIPVY